MNNELSSLQRQAQAAFEEMKAAEMRMDDMDILKESTLFRKAMAAADQWHSLCDQIEQYERKRRAGNRIRIQGRILSRRPRQGHRAAGLVLIIKLTGLRTGP